MSESEHHTISGSKRSWTWHEYTHNPAIWRHCLIGFTCIVQAYVFFRNNWHIIKWARSSQQLREALSPYKSDLITSLLLALWRARAGSLVLHNSCLSQCGLWPHVNSAEPSWDILAICLKTFNTLKPFMTDIIMIGHVLTSIQRLLRHSSHFAEHWTWCFGYVVHTHDVQSS